MATDNSLLIEQLLPDNVTGDIDPADVRAVAHALDSQVPNQRRGGPFLVSYLTHAAAVAAGQPTAASLDQLEAERLCLGAAARVAQHPDQAGQWLVLVFDAGATAGVGGDGAGPVTSGLPVALDGNFQDTVPGKWVKLGSAEATAANVPAYAGNVVYTVGYLVRYALLGEREWFYYSRQAGHLPAPVAGQTSASWRIIPPPVAETLLYQYLSLGEAQGINGIEVVAGRRYVVAGQWNGSADDQLVFLDGLKYYFRRRGTLLLDDGSQQEVEADVQAGTYTVPATSGSGGPPRAAPWAARDYVQHELAEAGGGLFRAQAAFSSAASPLVDLAGWDVVSLPLALVELDNTAPAQTWNGVQDAFWLLRDGATRTLTLAADFVEGPTRALYVATDNLPGNNLTFTAPSGFTKYVLRGMVTEVAGSRTSYTVSRHGTEFRITVGPNYQQQP